MTNNYYNYVRNLLTIIATFFVCGNAGATPVTFGTGNSTYEENADGSYTVTLKAAGDLKSMEITWSWGSNTPWKSASKLILYLDESIGSSAIQEIKDTDELYLLTQNTTVSTLDLSNLSNDQADYLKPDVKWPDQWSTQSQSLRNIIVPDKYATTPNSYASNQINSIGKTGSTIYLYRQYNNYDIEWSLIRNDETTLKIVGEYSNGFNISNATYFENIDLTTLSFSSENAKITLPTVGADGVALTKIIVISNDAISMIANTDATTLAAVETVSGGGSGSGEGGEGGGGDDPVDTSTLEYKIAHKLQLTNAPTVYITLPDIGDATLDSYLYKIGGNATTAADAPYRRASIKVVATTDTTSPHYMESFEEDADHLEIKVRGNSTSLQNVTDAKRPYRLKFAKKEKTTGQDFKHDMTNAGYSKRNWVLLANAFDHSLIRNALTCELGKIVGMPFNPGYKFVDLVINGNYRGTYQITDQPEVDGNRINVDEDTGWYVEFQGRPDMCDYPMCINESGKITMNINNPEPDDETDESQRNAIIDPIKTWFNDIWKKGFGTGFTNPATGWRAYNDEEEWLKFLIITEITGDYDGLMSVKAYREADGKLCLGPVWDKDLAYGNYGEYSTTMVADIGNASSINGYVKQLYTDPLFTKRLKEKMDELVTDDLVTTLCNKIDDLAALVAQTEAQNTEKWGASMNYYIENYHGLANHQAYVDQLKEWLTARVTFVQNKFNEYYVAANTATAFTYDVSTTSSENLTTQRDKLVNVTMTNRSFTANAWNAISLPFSVDETQLKSIFGDNYELKEFVGVDETDATKMLFKTPADNAIVAGMPYLIKPSTTVAAQPVFNNVIIGAVPRGWADSFYYGGESVTYGNYTYVSHLVKDYAANRKVIGSDATTFTDTDGRLYDGSLAFIRILNNAATPTIVFAEDTPPVVRTQLTNLPTIYIDTKDNAAINPSSGDWTQAGIQVIDENNTLKPFVYAADAVTAKGKPVFQIRGRGAASWTNAEKKSYRIQFGKDDKDELGNVTTSYKHYLLGNEDAAGVVKKRNWVLLANAGDKTLVRNALTKEIGDAVGLPFTPGYQFVDLVLNGTYVGTYQVTEFIEADANRVNIDEDNGLLIQMTGQADTSTGDHIIAGTDSKPYLTIKNPEIKAANQAAWNAAFNTDIYDFDGMWSATNGTGLDKSTLVNWYIASEITGNYEALSSIYAYLDATTKNLCFGPLWNNETAFDNHASINMTSAELMNDAENDDTHNGLLTQAGKDAAWKTKLEDLWTRKWFAAAVYERWEELYNNGNLTTELTGKVDELAAIVNNNTKSSQALNFSPAANGGAGWTITGQGITGYSKEVTNSTYADEVLRLKTYLEQRLPYLDKKFKALGEVDGPEITIGTGGYSSFSWDGALDFSGTEVEVYVATSYVKGILQLEKVADGKIPAETGVILKGNEGDKIYPQTISESVSLTATNILLNTAKATFDVPSTVPSTDSYYALATLNGKTALYKIKSGVRIPLYKAYLSVSVTSQQAPAAIFFGDIDGGTTGLNEISVNADSQHEAVYDLQGRRMKGNLAKGIYIKNGKKIIVK